MRFAESTLNGVEIHCSKQIRRILSRPFAAGFLSRVPVHICYIADARSPIANSWISYFVEKGYRITVLSSYPCRDDEIPGATIVPFPLVWTKWTNSGLNGHGSSKRAAILLPTLPVSLRMHLRAWLAPLSIRLRSSSLGELISDLKPDLVHAMRLPYEGLFAAAAVNSAPLLISVWGNDLTLFAERYPRLGKLTDAALRRADGLHCDCERDRKLALTRGFSEDKPIAVLPGNGGIDTGFYFSLRREADVLSRFGIPIGRRLVINPRGIRAYVRNDTFFKAIPLVLQEVPDAFFIAPGMRGNKIAERQVRRLGISESVVLLPILEREDLGRLFAASEVMVSASSHDGTPNSLIEAMACGCLPVVGGVESIKEWITHGQNGLFCDEGSPQSLAAGLIRALKDEELRRQAAHINRGLIQAKAERSKVMAQAEDLYAQVLHHHADRSTSETRRTSAIAVGAH